MSEERIAKCKLHMDKVNKRLKEIQVELQIDSYSPVVYVALKLYEENVNERLKYWENRLKKEEEEIANGANS